MVCPMKGATDKPSGVLAAGAGSAPLPVPRAFALCHKDKEILELSSSGGAFTAIAQSFCDADYAVFGASLGADLRSVRHTCATDLCGLSAHRKSKYLQSDAGGAYLQARGFLDSGKKVLFTGLPCQIAGLRSFLLGKDYLGLLTVDLICHGAPSPLVYKKYLGYLEGKHKKEVVSFDFKSKERYGWGTNVKIELAKNGGAKKTLHIVGADDPFMIAFISRLCLRPSCHACPFATIPRMGDFTIGDFWGADEILPHLDSDRGLSVLLANTERAVGLLPGVGEYSHIEEVDPAQAVRHNRNLREPTPLNPQRGQFMGDLRERPFGEVIHDYLKPRPAVRRLASRFLSKNAQRRIKAILKK